MTAKAAIHKSIGLLALAAVLTCASARAADLGTSYKAPVYSSPQPVFSWTGLYGGLNAGGDFSTGDAYTNLAGTGGGKLHGAIGGLQVGYGYQLSPMFVVGIENDFEATRLSNHDPADSAAVRMPWLMSGRARAGLAIPDSRLLVFGTAGLASGELKDGATSKMKMGWTAGGGVEWAFLPRWSAKLEYLYTDLKHDKLPDWNEANFHVVRLGVNYHFDLLR